MRLSDQISLKLQSFCRSGNSDIVLPNFYVGFYEMDVFRLLPTGYLYEYEIKISRGDFKNDFKKGSKHSLMATGKSKCNRFYFCTPEGLIHPNEIPDYAGLIEFHVNTNGEVCSGILTKNAKMLHKNKVDEQFYKDIAYKLSFREVQWRNQSKIFKSLYEETLRVNKDLNRVLQK
jgi:hypothetical protein